MQKSLIITQMLQVPLWKHVAKKKYDETIELKQCDKKDIIIAPTAVDFIKIYFKGYKNIIYWMQGLDSEESFMRNGS